MQLYRYMYIYNHIYIYTYIIAWPSKGWTRSHRKMVDFIRKVGIHGFGSWPCAEFGKK